METLLVYSYEMNLEINLTLNCVTKNRARFHNN